MPANATSVTASSSTPLTAAALAGVAEAHNPIDHIFQFHKALRREVKHLEREAQALSNHVESGGDEADLYIQQLEGRYFFLKGVYIAHSEVPPPPPTSTLCPPLDDSLDSPLQAEDHIVFPALERKEVLRNVSHAYSLDHQKEQELFSQVGCLLAGGR